MNENTKWYLDFIKREIEKLRTGNFTGNVDFKVNWKDGAIGNLNCVLAKSVRHIERDK